jgi:hypothetical protein
VSEQAGREAEGVSGGLARFTAACRIAIGAREQLPPRGHVLASLIAGAGVGLGAVAAAHAP